MANSLLESNIKNYDLPKFVNDIYLDSISQKTRRLYLVYIKRWITFSIEKDFDARKPTIKWLLLFLASLVRKGISYSAVNVARSAISFFAPIFEGYKLGAHPDVCRFLAGVKRRSPKISRYSAVWDVDIVFRFLVELWPLRSLPLNLLVKKFVVLFLLVTSHRVQSLQVLKVTNLVWPKQDVAVFLLDERLKHVKSQELGFIQLNAFFSEPKLCVVKCLKEYINRTANLRKGIRYLVLTTTNPIKPASHDTIARWVSDVLSDAGVDVSCFKPHSTRSASSSKLISLKVPIDQVLTKAGWSSESTFRKFYDKPIIPDGDVSQSLIVNFLKKQKVKT